MEHTEYSEPYSTSMWKPTLAEKYQMMALKNGSIKQPFQLKGSHKALAEQLQKTEHAEPSAILISPPEQAQQFHFKYSYS